MSNLENEVLLQQNALFERIQSVLQENHQLKQELSQLEAREELFREIAENVREVFLLSRRKLTKYSTFLQHTKKFGVELARVYMKILSRG